MPEHTGRFFWTAMLPALALAGCPNGNPSRPDAGDTGMDAAVDIAADAAVDPGVVDPPDNTGTPSSGIPPTLTSQCTAGPSEVLEPLWMAGGRGQRAELGKFGKPDAIFVLEEGVLLAGDEHADFEELHLYDMDTDDPSQLNDFITPTADLGADPGPGGDGPLEFRGISGFAQDRESKRLYVVEQGNDRIQLLTPTADPKSATPFEFEGFLGHAAPDPDNPADGEFVRLQAARVDSLGRLFVTDDARGNALTARHDVQVFSPDLQYLFKFGDSSYGSPGVEGNLVEPENFVIDEARDRIYVCDENTHDIASYRYTDQAFVARVGVLAGVPNGIDIDRLGFVYFVDEGARAVLAAEPETLNELYRFGAESGKDDFQPGYLNSPDTLITDQTRDLLLVADQGHDRIQAFQLSQVQQRACIRGLHVSVPPRVPAGATVTMRVEVLRRDGTWDRTGFRQTASVVALPQGGGSPVVGPLDVAVYNGVGTLTFPVGAAGELELEVSLGGLRATRPLSVVAGMAERALSGELAGADLSWGPDDGVIRLSGTTTVPAGATLEIEAGTLVMMDPQATLECHGSVSAKGTNGSPIYFFAADDGQPWGQIRHPGGVASWANTFFTGGGDTGEAYAFATSRHCCVPLIRADGGHFTMVRSVIADSPGKGLLVIGAEAHIAGSVFARLGLGVELDTAVATVMNSWFVDIRGGDDNDGLYLWGWMSYGLEEQTPQDHWQGKSREDEDIRILDSVFADGDDDGIDTRGASPEIDGCVVYGWADKGLSFTGAWPRVSDSFVWDNAIGVKVDWYVRPQSWLDAHPPPHTFGPELTGVTILGHSTAGLLLSDRGGLDADADIRPTLERVIIWETPAAFQTDFDVADITVDNSIFPAGSAAVSGTGNLSEPPVFISPRIHDYRLNPVSDGAALGDGGAGWEGF